MYNILNNNFKRRYTFIVLYKCCTLYIVHTLTHKHTIHILWRKKWISLLLTYLNIWHNFIVDSMDFSWYTPKTPERHEKRARKYINRDDVKTELYSGYFMCVCVCDYAYVHMRHEESGIVFAISITIVSSFALFPSFSFRTEYF